MFSTPCFCHGPTVRTSKQKRLHNSSRILCCTRRNSQTTDGVKTTSISDAKFSTWASENKVDMSSLILTKSKKTHFSNITSNRGMTAKVPLKKGDMMISVPKNVSLQVSSLDTKKTPFPEKITQETWQTLPWFVRLAFRILDAKSDPESILHPWIARLPRSFDTPFHWSEAELAELQSPRMVNEVTEQKKKYRKYFDDIIRNPGNTLLRNFTYSDFVWAVECVRSRAFSGPQEVAPFKERASLLLFVLANTLAWPALHILSFENAVNGGLTAFFALIMYDVLLPKILSTVQGVELKRFAMTPGIDFLNHSSLVSGKAEVTYDYFSEKFIVESGEEYKTGEEVFISYGAQSNDSFLQYYGFVEEDNAAETFKFGEDIAKMLGVNEGKLILRRSGFDKSTLLSVSKKLGGNEKAGLITLQKLCDAEVTNMATTVEQDTDLLKERKTKENPRLELAIQYRREKKKLLETIRSPR